MAYTYICKINGSFNFVIPGKGKSVLLVQGSEVTVDEPLKGGLLNVLTLVEETKPAPKKKAPAKTKVEDKITAVTETEEVKVEEVVETKK